MQRYNRTQAAKYLGIGRRTLFRWLEEDPYLQGQRTFTKAQLDRLAARRGKEPGGQETRTLRQEVEALRAELSKLTERVAALEGVKKKRARKTPPSDTTSQ